MNKSPTASVNVSSDDEYAEIVIPIEPDVVGSVYVVTVVPDMD